MPVGRGTREELVTVSDAKVKLAEVIRELDERRALLLRHGKPVAAMLAYDDYVSLLEKIDDLEDRLSIFEAREDGVDLRVGWEKVQAQAGLLGDD
jgi:PHD/YefM family antitoxin component YafN of YafNO toxin-antitoxin module